MRSRSKLMYSDACQVGVDLSGGFVKYVGSVAGYVGSAAGHYLAQMMLGDYLHGKVMVKYVDIRILPDRMDQTFLNLGAGVVGMVENTELGVPLVFGEGRL